MNYSSPVPGRGCGTPRSRVGLVFAGLVVSLGATIHAQEWTRFRGPNGSGLSDATTIPATWTDEDYRWKVDLPGVGHASPVIWGNKIFLLSADPETVTRIVLCLDAADGRTIWSRSYPSTKHVKHQFNSFASATPAVDEQQVYVAWSAPEEYTLAAFDHDGNERWKLNLGPYVSQHSCGTSPIVYEDLVILGNDQDGDSSLVAVERATGSIRWRVPRKKVVVAYSTPCVYAPEGEKPQLIFNSQAHGISSINPDDGQSNWELAVFDKRSVSSPLIAGGLIFGSCGSGAGGNYVVAIKPGAAGVAPEVAYKVTKSAPYVPTPVATEDFIFLWSDQGVVTCCDIATGKPIWQERVGGKYFGSPVCAGGRLYCMSADGEVAVVAASPVYEFFGKQPLGDPSHSTPAVSGGVMYLRTFTKLFALGGK